MLPSSLYQQGLVRAEQEDWPAAEHFFARVVELEPSYSPAWCHLGDAREQLGQRERAVAAWRRGPYAPRCLESMGRAVLDEAPDEAARAFEVLRRRTNDPAVGLLLARAIAASDPDEAVRRIEAYLELRSDTSPDLLPAVEAVVEVLEPDEADALLQAVVQHSPELLEPLEAKMEELDVEQRALELMGAAPSRLDGAQSALFEEAVRLHAAGRTADALAKAEALADRAARNPDVWALLADLREASGDIAGAERALWLARRLDPLEPELQVKHARILQEHFGGRFADEAFDALNQAVRVQRSGDVRWQHARLALQVGRLAEARASLARLAEEGPDADEAKRLLAGLERERAEPPILPSLGPPDGVDEEAWLATHRAQVWWERARTATPVDPEKLEHALEQLDAALALEPDLLEARNLRAQVRWATNDLDGARADWEASLAARRQPGVLIRLAEVARSQGREDEANRLLVEAADAGSSVAVFRLAQRDEQAGRWLQALERLDVYFGMASSGPVHTEALKLQAALWGKLQALAVAVLSTLALALALPVLFWVRRRSGTSVARWLEARPRSYRDVARITSAIRHEVLKHNISSLPMVADAVEVGDTEVVTWAEDRLRAALDQLDRYLDELTGLARDQGIRLNLRRRDPVFGPLIAHADRLRRAVGRLGNRRTAPELRAISEGLNETAYRDLGALVTGVCVLELDSDLFQTAWDAVCTEPSFVGRPLPAFTTDVPPLAVRVFRTDLLDVLANLLRNALEASLEEGRTRLAVKVRTDEDLITGLLRAEIRVCDDVARRLTTAMIRGRYIDRGLGLAVDLTSRAGGSVHVENEPGWAKAVVVRLPMEET